MYNLATIWPSSLRWVKTLVCFIISLNKYLQHMQPVRSRPALILHVFVNRCQSEFYNMCVTQHLPVSNQWRTEKPDGGACVGGKGVSLQAVAARWRGIKRQLFGEKLLLPRRGRWWRQIKNIQWSYWWRWLKKILHNSASSGVNISCLKIKKQKRRAPPYTLFKEYGMLRQNEEWGENRGI